VGAPLLRGAEAHPAMIEIAMSTLTIGYRLS
jgi:hypothetical protein